MVTLEYYRDDGNMPPMEIRQTGEDDAVVLHLAGCFDELATRKAEQAFQLCIDGKARQVILDMSGVDYISSSALRVILLLHRAITKRDGSVQLCNVTPFVAEVLETSNLNRILDITSPADAPYGSITGAA